MSLLASTINGAGYVLSNGEDKDNGNGFEFTRRKRWPQLLMQELVGSALFCVKPIVQERTSGETGGTQYTWKILFVSPSVEEMVGQSPTSLEGKDFLDLVHEPDKSQLTKFFTNLLAPSPSPHDSDSSTTTLTSLPTPSTHPQALGTSSKSQTTYIRINTVSPPSRRGSGSKQALPQKPPQIVWELRAHATGVEHPDEVEERSMQLGRGGNGTVSQIEGAGVDVKGKAIWVMGRAAGDSNGESEGNSQSLDAFLELKLENEKLREELRELQQEYGEDDMYIPSYGDISPSRPSTSHLQPSSPSTSEEDVSTSASSSVPSSPDYSSVSKPVAASKPGRPLKDPAAREKKKAKKTAAQSARAQGGNGEGGEGMHVCVTCGRTDSPEWRKGPLGPKTLCNACGLRWAKRNSSAPTRKERKVK